MIKNIFKIAVRNLLINKMSSFINIFGLSLGIACAIIIFTKIHYETSFDTFHSSKNRIFRLVRIENLPGGVEYRDGATLPLITELREQIPEIEKVCGLLYDDDCEVTIYDNLNKNSKILKIKGLAYIEPQFFDILDFKDVGFHWISGSPQLLNNPNNAAISEKTAVTYFGSTNVIGRNLNIYGLEYRITGVFADIPLNSDFPFKVLLPYANVTKVMGDFINGWGNIADTHQCFVRLKPNVKTTDIEATIADIYAKHVDKEVLKYRKYKLQPLSEVHTDAKFGNFNERVVSKSIILGLSIIGIFLILIACINYSNLAIARSTMRNKEVALRKVFGSDRKQIIWQFLGESFLITLIATNIGFIFAKIGILLFYNLFSLPQEIEISSDLLSFVFLLGSIVVISIVGGAYPALVSSRYNPVEVFKMQFKLPGKTGFNFSKMAIGIQIFMSLVLIAGTLIVYKQLHFINSFDLGYDRENIVIVDLPDAKPEHLQRFKEELLKKPAIEKVSFSSETPERSSVWSNLRMSKSGEALKIHCNFKAADNGFLNIYGLKLLEGRNLTENDSTHILVNEELIKEAGYKNLSEIIGNQATYWRHKGDIIGIVKDLHPRTLQAKVTPMCIYNDFRDFGEASIKLKINTNMRTGKSQLKETLAYIESQWHNIYPDNLYDFYFLDERINSFYKNEQKTAQLLDLFSVIAIFVSCLGIFGITYFLIRRKSKEIAVRRVNGASIYEIFEILSSSFIPWIVFASVLSTPVTIYVMSKWLEQYAYKTTISWWVFVVAFVIASMLVLLNILWLTYKAANKKPVEALRYE
jgi:putative ABC transport system permease protein